MFKGVLRLIRGLAIAIGAAVLVYFGAVVVLTLRQPQGSRPPSASPASVRPPLIRPARVALQPPSLPQGRPNRDCGAPRELADAAGANAASRTTLPITPFGAAETGWRVYEPLITREIRTRCPGDSLGFAARLRGWQAAHAIAATGRLDPATISAMALGWLRRRPFVAAMRQGCPPAPDPSRLAVAGASEAYGGKVILARPAALGAYRRMVAAARRDGIAGPLLQIASAWRGPGEEAARCADDSCGTAAKAHCSAHRTGLAFDFVLDAALGSAGFSTDPVNRVALSQTPAYRWLVAHADRFGFVNYPYEPWHWEWTGENI